MPLRYDGAWFATGPASARRLRTCCAPALQPRQVSEQLEVRRFHNLVRGLILEDDMVLVAHAHGASNTFLPGGHIEVGESASAALARELMEEIGMASRVGQFLGCLEHRWDESGCEHYEINHVFRLHVPALSPGVDPQSREDHLALFWLPVNQLSERNLQPAALIGLIMSGQLDTMTTWWDSSLSKE
jgi:8-oxo-dGTP diphosphatase